MDTASQLFLSGKLGEAVQAQTDHVRSKPTDVAARFFLAELLCIAGNLERADSALETIDKMQPGPRVNLYRQLIRAEKTRSEVCNEGRAPEFVTDPTPCVELYLKARLALREGDQDEAVKQALAAEEARVSPKGTCNGQSFDELRDLDDLTGGVFEVLTSTGRYMWVPIEHVLTMDFDKPESPLDLLWRPCEMNVSGGPDGKVFLPTTYHVGDAEVADAVRLGRATEWNAVADDVMRGEGLRTFLVGEEAMTVMELESVTFGDEG